jgi:hypothetical protein
MLTLFTTAKPFEGRSGIIQRNALKSWKLIKNDAERLAPGTIRVEAISVDELCVNPARRISLNVMWRAQK